MKKISEFLVKKRNIVLAVVLIFAAVSAVLMGKVNIITDMTEYLPDDSSMKQGIDIMSEEFGGISSPNTIRIMSTDLSESDKETLITALLEIENVESIDYDYDSEDYNKDNHSLFVLNTEFDYDSEEMEKIQEVIESDFCDAYNLVYTTGNTQLSGIPAWILGIALLILMVVLFLMCSSWIEPFLFLATIGVAIVINMGTNAFLSGVSSTTHSIAAILQLVLSMDYSIILINRYRQELSSGKEKYTAMASAIKGAAASIASSSLTTIVGLLALLFMSFKIGADMGIVLAKGVLISMLCILTVLPALILMCDKAIQKTAKKVIPIPMRKISSFSFKGRYVISGVFVVFFAAVLLLKGDALITYTMNETNEVDNVFPQTNSVVVLYDNNDEKDIAQLASDIENQNGVKSVSSYATTLGKKYTSAEITELVGSMSENMTFDESSINMIYYDYFDDSEEKTMTLSQFMTFMQNYISSDSDMVSQLDEHTMVQLEMIHMFTSKEGLIKKRNVTELSQIFGIDEQMLSQMMAMTGSETISIQGFLQLVSSSPEMAQDLTSAGTETSSQIAMVQNIVESVMSDTEYAPSEMASMFSNISDELNESSISLMYKLYFSQANYDNTWKMSMDELFTHIINMTENEQFTGMFDESVVKSLKSYQNDLENGKNQLVGENYSLMMIATSLSEESNETNEFLDNLEKKLNDNLENDYYLIGNSPMQYEMSRSFSDELNKISIITAIAIFIVVLITFRSISVPVILILVIQSAVYATMVIMTLQGSGMYYLALLIVQSILMGATIDYGILFTNYYREKRKSLEPKDALLAAYDGPIHTILTSGMIMVLVTWILGYAFGDPSIGQICHLIAMGVTCALILIIFILPGVLVALDRFTCGIKQGKKK